MGIDAHPFALGITSCGHNSDPRPVLQEIENARNAGVVGLENFPIIVKRHITIKRHKFEPTTTHQTHDLRRIEDQPHIVETRRHESAKRDPPLLILIAESILQRQRSEECPHGGYEELKLGDSSCVARAGLGDVVPDQFFDVLHYLTVASLCAEGHV